MEISFNPEIASKYGLHEAIVISVAEDFYNEGTFFFETKDVMERISSVLSEKQVRCSLKKLVDTEFLNVRKERDCNKNVYSITDKVYEIEFKGL